MLALARKHVTDHVTRAANDDFINSGPCNQTKYEYDEENRLRSANGAGYSTTYDYDPYGRRRAKTVNGTVTRFLSDNDDEIGEYSSTSALYRRYINGPGVDEHLVQIESGGAHYYFQTNHQGTTLFTSDTLPTPTLTPIRYGSYGDSDSAATGVAFRYTGRRLDAETGLYYYRARYYSPSLGRFLQTDAIGDRDDLNRYTYVGNDPLDRTDPSGNYGQGAGWDESSWKKFNAVQQRAAGDMEKQADKLDAKADKLDAKGKTGGDALRSTAGNLRSGASALRSDGSDGKVANRVDAKTYQSMGGSEHGAAFVKGTGPIMTVNGGNAAAWTTGSSMSQWVVGHESLHTAGLIDQRGPNGAIAYKFGFPANMEAFRAISGTDKANINPDSIMDLVYP
jgi:RHS repeat-associated protein